MKKIMLSAGEASGDLHGAGIAAALQAAAGDVEMFGMGGAAMRQAGVDVLYDIAEYSVMGFAEVVKNLPRLFALRDSLVDVMRERRPDVLVIIDYPDFNLRLAERAKQLGIPVFSYIPPSAWAWRRGRAKKVAQLADKIGAVFPFEVEVYEKAGADITFVGNPLVDIVKPQLDPAAARRYFAIEPSDKPIVLLPGSRKQEIDKLLPLMLESAVALSSWEPRCKFFLPVASTISSEIIGTIARRYRVKVQYTSEYTYDLMNVANVAIAASGTVTLEAALLGLPSVVVYKMAALTYFIGSLLVKLPNVSLPNIILSQRVLPELIQRAATSERIVEETRRFMTDGTYRAEVDAKLKTIAGRLGGGGAARRTAELILATARR